MVTNTQQDLKGGRRGEEFPPAPLSEAKRSGAERSGAEPIVAVFICKFGCVQSIVGYKHQYRHVFVILILRVCLLILCCTAYFDDV